MFAFLKSEPVLDESAIAWLFDCYAWALRSGDAAYFFNTSCLVLPTNTFFPDRASTPQQLAASVFANTKELSGLSHWPFYLVEPQHYRVPKQMRVTLRGPMRQANSIVADYSMEPVRFPLSYHPAQIKQPEVLIANFAQGLAYYVATHFSDIPPGGEDYRPQATELLGIFWGFGIMFANSAYTFKGSCARCYDPAATRSAAIHETEVVYALAIFMVLKDLSPKDALPHLKPYLRRHFKRCIKDVKGRSEELTRLQSYAA